MFAGTEVWWSTFGPPRTAVYPAFRGLFSHRPLYPRGIFRRFWRQCLCVQRSVKRIDIIHSKNHATPPPPVMCLARDQIDERFSRPQAAEGSTFAAIQQAKSELPVEFDGTDHVING